MATDETPAQPDEGALRVLKFANQRIRALLIANASRLDTPFTDQPDTSPWTMVSRALGNLDAAVKAVLGGPVAASPDDHPEDTCHRCGGPNVTWCAPSPLWNEVMRGGDINAADRFDGIVCPACFAVLAEAAGIAEFWRFSADRVHRELKTVTPSGRTWNEATWMWEASS